MLNGYKTYIATGLGIILAGIHSMGYITDVQFTNFGALLGFAGLGFLRNAVTPPVGKKG